MSWSNRSVATINKIKDGLNKWMDETGIKFELRTNMTNGYNDRLSFELDDNTQVSVILSWFEAWTELAVVVGTDTGYEFTTTDYIDIDNGEFIKRLGEDVNTSDHEGLSDNQIKFYTGPFDMDINPLIEDIKVIVTKFTGGTK